MCWGGREQVEDKKLNKEVEGRIDMKMNTPTAIFLGLTLIAVAIFFRQPSISEAQAKA